MLRRSRGVLSSVAHAGRERDDLLQSVCDYLRRFGFEACGAQQHAAASEGVEVVGEALVVIVHGRP